MSPCWKKPSQARIVKLTSEEKGKPRRLNHRFWDNFKISQKRGSQKCKSHFNKSRECRALCSNQVEYIGSVLKFDPRKLIALGVKEFCPILRNSGDKMAAFELKSRFCLHDLKLRFE
uniref:Uncharacterized protein n=1 Tax=Echinococcus canadensis TaxID=519352 RepID=A0A915EX58_9CEST